MLKINAGTTITLKCHIFQMFYCYLYQLRLRHKIIFSLSIMRFGVERERKNQIE